MAKNRSSRSPKTQSSKGRSLGVVISIGLVALSAIFLCTGTDPLGLFTETPSAPSTPESGDVATPSDGSGGSGDWWHVYFTDPHTINNPENLSGSIPEMLIEYIDNAERSIHIAAFEFNLTPVAEALMRAQARGVDVKWVTDDENGLEADIEEGHGQFKMLKEAGIEVRDDGRGALMHNKFWIFDGQTVWTGSTNITINGNFRNNNNVIVIQSPELARIYEREFQEMWDGEFGPRSPSTLKNQWITIGDTPIQALFAPEDEVISQLIPIIAEAQDNIRFMAFSFTQDDLEAAMMERFEAHVDLAGIFETRGSETEYSAMPGMYCAGVPVRQDGNPGTFHHKVIVIDDEILITGSLNFSENADDSNDENVIIIANTDIAKLYLQEFERRWSEAKELDRGEMGCQ